jgi:putative Mg2+ transporter-C (MgtC) family protein
MGIDFAADGGYALRLLLAAVLGALVGLEREIFDHPAGMRTHLLVALGSAAFTVLSIAAFPAPGADPARIAAQVVSGIGFLGAGAILKEGATIRGLTTAASMWAVAAVGMAAGAGAWLTALTITLIAIVSLWPLRVITRRVIERDQHRIRFRLLAADPSAFGRLMAIVSEHGASVARLTTASERGDRMSIDLEARARDVQAGAALTAAVASVDGIEIDESIALSD